MCKCEGNKVRGCVVCVGGEHSVGMKVCVCECVACAWGCGCWALCLGSYTRSSLKP